MSRYQSFQMHDVYFTLSSSSSFKSLSQLSRCSIWRSFFLSFLTWRYNSQSFSFSIISTLMVVFIGSLKLSRTYNWSDHGCQVKTSPSQKREKGERAFLVSNINKHLALDSILADCHGFRSQRSCETQLVQFVHDTISNLDGAVNRGHKQTDFIIMDFAKAFDKVPHRRLLHKLEYYGIRGSTHKWIY